MSGEHSDEAQTLIAAAIDAAEEVHDPLDGLVERTTADPGAAFAPEMLERLGVLKRDDRAAFETLRAQLKEAGCRVTELDDAIPEKGGEAGGREPSQADVLIELAQTAELFHDPDGKAFADLEVNGHRETWPVRSNGFKLWLARRYYEKTAGAVSGGAQRCA
jgi:hypothetical protein